MVYRKNYQKLGLLLFLGFLLFGCKKDKKNQYDNDKAVGESNLDLLTNDTYKAILVEIQYANGYKPTDQTISELTDFINETTHKSKGVIVKTEEVSLGTGSTYSIDEIRDFEDANRVYSSSGDTVAIYSLCLNNDYEGNEGNNKVLGVAYQNTSMALFQKSIHDLSGGFGQPSTWLLESTVINHEFGHILGLVNNHTDMVNNHQDSANGHHCNNENCLMYWLAETGGFVDNLIGVSSVPDIDQNCKNDLSSLQ